MAKENENNNKASLEITHCSQCPFLDMRRHYSADSFETAFDWHCKKKDGEKIQGYVDWNEEDDVKIPDWCPIIKK